MGPFGRVFLDDELDLFHQLREAHPLFYYPQIKTHQPVFPLQQDSWNCGIFIILSIIDLVIGQWEREWYIIDVIKKGEQVNSIEEIWSN